MSKLANILKMIIMLEARETMKVKEIAAELEIDERMVRRYRDDLEQAEIYIDSLSGPYGGYSLKERNFLNLNLKREEYGALIMANEQLKNDNSFMFTKELEGALDKIKLALEENKSSILENEYCVINSKPNINLKEEKRKYIICKDAILTQQKIKMTYFSLSSGAKERIVRPYAIFMHKGFWYFIGFCELREEIREFKLTRIKEISLLKEKFDKPENFSLKEYMENNIGIFKDKTYELKLEISYPMSIIVAESVWVENQEITWQEDKSILFEAKMQGLPEIKSWLLSLGSSVKIIEPIELKEELKKEIEKMKKLY